MKLLKWKDAEELISKNKGPIYIWFGTEWCGDCKMMLPIIESVEKKFSNDEIQFIKVDAEESGLFRNESKYQVKRIPTHVFIKNSDIKSIMYEYIPEDIINMEIEKLKYEK